MSAKLLTAIGMIAVSTEPQRGGVSLDEQERAIRARCTQEGWRLLEPLIVLPGVSRSDPDIVEIFSGGARQFAPYVRLRELIKSQTADILVAYDDGRIGRSKTMFSYITENAIVNGMRVLVLDSGWINADNEDYAILFGRMKATSGLKRFKRMTEVAMLERMERGLWTQRPPFTHKPVYNERGEPIGLALREELRRLFDDAVTLLLEGVGWNWFPRQMAERFGHINPSTGNPYYQNYFYRLFHNPYTWGNTARRFLHKEGLWGFDENAPLPEGVIVNCHPNPPVPPVFTGEQAELIKAELRRRGTVIRGKASPARSYKFTGLFMCEECGHRMVMALSDSAKQPMGQNVYWVCNNTKRGAKSLIICNQRRTLREDRAVDQITRYFEMMKQLHITDIGQMSGLPERADLRERITSLTREIVDLDSQIKTMILQQAKAGLDVQEHYAVLISQAGDALNAKKSALAQTLAQNDSPADVAGRPLAFEEMMRDGLPAFWQRDSRSINQVLHRVMGKHRFVVRDGEIVRVF